MAKMKQRNQEAAQGDADTCATNLKRPLQITCKLNNQGWQADRDDNRPLHLVHGAKCVAKELQVADVVDQPGPTWSWDLEIAPVFKPKTHCEVSKLEPKWPWRTPVRTTGQMLALYAVFCSL